MQHYCGITGALSRKATEKGNRFKRTAASALQHKLELFSLDGHFKAVKDLTSGGRLSHFVS